MNQVKVFLFAHAVLLYNNFIIMLVEYIYHLSKEKAKLLIKVNSSSSRFLISRVETVPRH